MNIKVYQAGLKFMLINTVKRLFNGEVYFEHSLDHGIYGKIKADATIDQNNLNKIKEYMHTMVQQDLPFSKKTVGKNEAYNFYKNKGNYEKAHNVLNISNEIVSMVSLEGQYNYFYSHDMPLSTKVLEYFDLYYVKDNEFVLIYPFNGKLSFTFRHKIHDAFVRCNAWADNIGIKYVSDLNNIISSGGAHDLVRKCDIVYDSHLYEISRNVVEQNKKILLLAGPSSSGKTTSSRKLSLYLSTIGYNAIPISLDDFFIDKDKTPLKADGTKDFESIRAIDLNLFYEDMTKLLNGEEVHLPIYDFVSGTHTLAEDATKLTGKDIIVIEGLHAINPELTSKLDQNIIYKVYISPFTPLGIDRHNYVSTTDNRLLRRMIRDFKTRGMSPETTLLSWNSVREGEEQYIFPYTDTVDYILNTSFLYEIGMLKVYAEPLLASIPMESEAYFEARRLLDSFRPFYPISSEYIEEDCLLREFIGGSVFERNE